MISAILVANTTVAAPPELRGTWLTTTPSDAIDPPAKIDTTMRRLADIGLNTVYVACPTPAPDRPDEVVPRHDDTASPQRDRLAEATIAAHRNGLLCIASLTSGFMATTGVHDALIAKKEWLTAARGGGTASRMGGSTWLNPFHPDVQQFLIDAAVAVLKSHDVDGIQLDDHLALPIDLGYDPYTRAFYKKETGRDVPDDFTDAAWKRWRADKISDFALRFVVAMREANVDLIISVAPAPAPEAYDESLCDWVAWTRWCECRGYKWTEFVPQTCCPTASATTQSVQQQIDRVGDEKVNLAAGIRVDGGGPDMSFDDVRTSIEFCRKQQLAGHVLRSSRGVLDVYPTQFAAFYDVAKTGRAPNPFKPYDWRPMPIVATRVGEVWHATVKTAGKYEVIVHADDAWHATKTIDAAVGDQTLDAAGDAVELLVDHRP